MIGATVIAIFFIPMFYWVIETLLQKMSARGKTTAEDEQAGPAKMEGEGAEGATPAPALTKEPRE